MEGMVYLALLALLACCEPFGRGRSASQPNRSWPAESRVTSTFHPLSNGGGRGNKRLLTLSLSHQITSNDRPCNHMGCLYSI
ncbi:hypothetical protein QR685DRAFT_513407, partial [Neurospora intermedia]